MSVDLSTRYLGLELANPMVPSASPLTGELDTLRRLEAAGAAAVVLPSLFEEQIEHESMAVHRSLEFGAGHFAEAASGYLPEMEDYKTGPGQYLKLIEDASWNLSIPVIASLNGHSRGGWTLYARLCEEAGASALELNIYYVAADPSMSAEQVELQYLELVATVTDAVTIPVAVKIGPYFSAMARMAERFAVAGADGLVLFNRFYQPDIDLEEMAVQPNLVLSTPAEARLVLRWMAILFGHTDMSLAATTGVHEAEDAVKLILAGADVTMMASALLRNGPEHLATVLTGVETWFDEHGYESVQQARGSMSRANAPDSAAFERANYMRTLLSYSSPV
jgi:dihydroorotate dehydrogenase (fumarate)